ncbi:PREDICTED: uncharacterized protein LOC100641394 [Amphimedon queenslandica]|uniref:Tryptophan-rich sensory protein n=1 Tax=Amphimedon queenslandica TaxID=400682 RepID=A0A1X7TZN7_AMPQE|nr:PREDICTED: uncharacterized protein LOC100641394 [Amphimedon queenslandica]|eukprot:XP_003389432.1 PREDICTED: uncharacterized protein LOC100641394 [Amphimedon queenslandica]
MSEKPLVKSSSSPVNSLAMKVLEIVGLSITTAILISTFIINGFAAASDPEKFGFKNQTGDVADTYFTQINPNGWTFSIWGVIYAWQALWILYGWSFVFRPSFKKTINPLVYFCYAGANCCNIIWIYLWGNLYPQAAFPFIVLIAVSLWAAIAIEVGYLRYLKPHDGTRPLKFDYYITQFLVVNGLVIYGTWTAIASLINFDVVISYFGKATDITAATVALSILTFELLLYFVLENTVLDRFVRFIFMVYPVVIWALSGVLSRQAEYKNGDGKRNFIFTAVLLGIALLLFIVRIILWIVFAFVRPLKKVLDVKKV